MLLETTQTVPRRGERRWINGSTRPPGYPLLMAGTPLLSAFGWFVDSLRAAKKSPNTVDAYRRDLLAVANLVADSLDREVGDLQVADLDLHTLRRAFGVRAETSSAATVARTHSSWTKFFKFARVEGLVESSPMDDIEKAKVGGSKPKSIDVADLATKILDAAANPPTRSRGRWAARDKAVVATLMTTGVRLAELVDLDTSSVVGTDGVFQLDVVGKGSKYRAVPLLPQVRDLIETYLGERRERFPDHDLVNRGVPLFIQTTSGDRMSRRQIQYLLEALYREAGIRGQVPSGALVHALRHTFAMDLLDNGASIVEVQTLLGHESLATTRRYLTARPHELRDAVSATAAGRAIR